MVPLVRPLHPPGGVLDSGLGERLAKGTSRLQIARPLTPRTSGPGLGGGLRLPGTPALSLPGWVNHCILEG